MEIYSIKKSNIKSKSYRCRLKTVLKKYDKYKRKGDFIVFLDLIFLKNIDQVESVHINNLGERLR